MKKLLLLMLCMTITFSVCACGNADSKQPIESTQITNNSNNAENVFIPGKDEADYTLLLATDYLSSIIDISDKRQDDSYLVYGIDRSSSDCYGIWRTDGSFELLDAYEVYFSLADECFLVTNDVDVSRELRPYTNESNGITHGKIIDRSGKILFEAGENQRLHIINSTAIMIIEASSGFDYEVVRWGVIDSNGNWLHKMDNTGMPVEYLTNNLEFNSDGTWEYSSISIKPSENYDSIESGSLIFFRYSDYTALIYQLETDSFTSTIVNSSKIKQTASNEWVYWNAQVAGIPWGSKGIFRSFDQYGNDLGTAYYSEPTIINGIKYWHGYVQNTELIDNQYEVNFQFKIYSDNNPEGYVFSVDYSERIHEVIGFLENRICLLVKGADGLLYFVAHDMGGNTVIQPTLVDKYDDGRAVMIEDIFVYYDTEDGLPFTEDYLTLCLLNPSTGETITHYLGIDEYPAIWSLGNGLFAVRFEVDGLATTSIFSLSGEQLF